MIIETLSGIALQFIAVKNEYDLVLFVCAIVAEDVHQFFSRGGDIAFCKLIQPFPCEYDVISVNNEVILLFGFGRLGAFKF